LATTPDIRELPVAAEIWKAVQDTAPELALQGHFELPMAQWGVSWAAIVETAATTIRDACPALG